MVKRVEVTDKAAAMVARLKAQHDALLFHQSGGCCDGSAPMCYPASEFRTCCWARSPGASSISRRRPPQGLAFRSGRGPLAVHNAVPNSPPPEKALAR